MSKTFMYFAYGSNLLTRRIHVNNPSAARVNIGKLKNYRLDFITYSHRWKGASATVVPHEGKCVWGAIWEIGIEHLKNLDKQEGVDSNIYFPFDAEIETPDGKQMTCRIYQQTATPEYVPDLKDLPEDRRPSQVYLNTILEGAEESGLPEEYRMFLRGITHNGYSGDVDIFTPLHVK